MADERPPFRPLHDATAEVPPRALGRFVTCPRCERAVRVAADARFVDCPDCDARALIPGPARRLGRHRWRALAAHPQAPALAMLGLALVGFLAWAPAGYLLLATGGWMAVGAIGGASRGDDDEPPLV